MYVFVAIIQKNVNIAAHPTAVSTSNGTFKHMFPCCNMHCSYIAPFQAVQLERYLYPLGLRSNVLLGHTSPSPLGSCGLVPSTAELGGRHVGCGKRLMLKLVETLWGLQQGDEAVLV